MFENKRLFSGIAGGRVLLKSTAIAEKVRSLDRLEIVHVANRFEISVGRQFVGFVACLDGLSEKRHGATGTIQQGIGTGRLIQGAIVPILIQCFTHVVQGLI